MTPTEDYKAGETQALLSELNRVKVLFQARAVAAVLGVGVPTEITTHRAARSACADVRLIGKETTQ